MHSADSSLVFERSLAKTAAMLAGGIVLTGMSYLFISQRILNFAFEAWLLGLLLGPAAILANIVALFRGGPQVVFDEKGIHDSRTFGLIPWTEIDCLQVGFFYADKFLCLYLVDEPARLAEVSMLGRIALRLNHVKGCPAFTVRFKGLTPGIKEAWEYLETHHPDKIYTTTTPATPATVRS